jgi:hypothetical protein
MVRAHAPVRPRRARADARRIPTACLDDAAFGYVAAFKDHVNVGFFFGAELADPAGLLVGTGKRMRHVKLGPGRTVDAAALGSLIAAAYARVRKRLGE